MKIPSSTFGRRDALRMLVLVPAAAALAACSGPDKPDELIALARAAKADAQLADAIGKAHSQLATPAQAVSAARTAHAQALQREIDRLKPRDPADPPSVPAPPPQPTPRSASAAITALRTAMQSAQDQAAQLVATLPPYRAGLVGSMAASCASLQEVLP